MASSQIAHQPEILAAFNPLYGLSYLHRAGLFDALLILSALMLVVTGGEAMYADVGHFGARPIRASWFAVVFPALLLNYLGQGAYVLSGAPVAGGKLFYSLVPQPLLYPMVLLATVATVIASQALISGAFSLVSQAIRLGLFPRLTLLHTHEARRADLCAVRQLGAVCRLRAPGPDIRLQFGAGGGLWAGRVRRHGHHFARDVSDRAALSGIGGAPPPALVWGLLTAVNASFLVASSLKFLEGGFVPLSVGVAVFAVMTTWRWGRKATFAAYSAKPTMTMAELVALHRELQGVHGAKRHRDVAEAAAPARPTARRR